MSDEAPNIQMNIWVVDWAKQKRKEGGTKEKYNKGSRCLARSVCIIQGAIGNRGHEQIV